MMVKWVALRRFNYVDLAGFWNAAIFISRGEVALWAAILVTALVASIVLECLAKS